MPEIVNGAGEEQWEHRAALLVQGGQLSPVANSGKTGELPLDGGARKRSQSVVSTVDTDASIHQGFRCRSFMGDAKRRSNEQDNIQEAIRLHEAGGM